MITVDSLMVWSSAVYVHIKATCGSTGAIQKNWRSESGTNGPSPCRTTWVGFKLCLTRLISSRGDIDLELADVVYRMGVAASRTRVRQGLPITVPARPGGRSQGGGHIASRLGYGSD